MKLTSKLFLTAMLAVTAEFALAQDPVNLSPKMYAVLLVDTVLGILRSEFL